MKRPIYQLNTSCSHSGNIHWTFAALRVISVEKRIRGVGLWCLQFEVEMLCSQVQVLLVVLFSSVLLVHVSGAPRRDMLTEMLRADLSNDKVGDSCV